MFQLLRLIIFNVFSLCVVAQHYEDKRCRCVCPSPTSVFNQSLSIERQLFIANVPPDQCNCDGVILPRVGDAIRLRAMEYCPRCECRYESRNSTVIMVVVVFVVLVLSSLMGYMGFLVCLQSFVRQKHKSYMDASGEVITHCMHGYFKPNVNYTLLPFQTSKTNDL